MKGEFSPGGQGQEKSPGRLFFVGDHGEMRIGRPRNGMETVWMRGSTQPLGVCGAVGTVVTGLEMTSLLSKVVDVHSLAVRQVGGSHRGRGDPGGWNRGTNAPQSAAVVGKTA